MCPQVSHYWLIWVVIKYVHLYLIVFWCRCWSWWWWWPCFFSMLDIHLKYLFFKYLFWKRICCGVAKELAPLWTCCLKEAPNQDILAVASPSYEPMNITLLDDADHDVIFTMLDVHLNFFFFGSDVTLKFRVWTRELKSSRHPPCGSFSFLWAHCPWISSSQIKCRLHLEILLRSKLNCEGL